MADSPYRSIPQEQRMSAHYRGKTAKRLGIGHMLLAILVISVQIAFILLVPNIPGRNIGTGFWSGAIFLMAGIAGVFSSTDPRRREPAISFLIFALMAAVAAVVALVITIHGLVTDPPSKDADLGVTLVCMAALMVPCFIEMLIAIVSVHLVCKGLFHCCVAVQQAIEDEASVPVPALYNPDKCVSPIPD